MLYDEDSDTCSPMNMASRDTDHRLSTFRHLSQNVSHSDMKTKYLQGKEIRLKPILSKTLERFCGKQHDPRNCLSSRQEAVTPSHRISDTGLKST